MLTISTGLSYAINKNKKYSYVFKECARKEQKGFTHKQICHNFVYLSIQEQCIVYIITYVIAKIKCFARLES